MISWGQIPYYDDVIQKLDEAITKIRAKTRQDGFEWLKRRTTGRTDSMKLVQMRRFKETSVTKSTRSASPRMSPSPLIQGECSRATPSEGPSKVGNPLQLSRIAEQTDYMNSPKCTPKCFNTRNSFKEKISGKLVEAKLEIKLLSERLKKM